MKENSATPQSYPPRCWWIMWVTVLRLLSWLHPREEEEQEEEEEEKEKSTFLSSFKGRVRKRTPLSGNDFIAKGSRVDFSLNIPPGSQRVWGNGWGWWAMDSEDSDEPSKFSPFNEKRKGGFEVGARTDSPPSKPSADAHDSPPHDLWNSERQKRQRVANKNRMNEEDS